MKQTIVKYSFPITVASALSAVIFIATTGYWFRGLSADMNSRILTVETGQGHIVTALEDLEDRVDDGEMTQTEIRVKLASIEAQLSAISYTMTEIKEELRK